MPSTHRAVDVVEAVHGLLLDLPLVGQNVFKGRVYDYDNNTPSHSLFLGSADAETTNTQVTDEQQLIRDQITVTGSEEILDKTLLEVHAEAYVKIMADITLGLAFVQETEYLGMSEPDYIEEARRPILQAVFTWRVTYRHSYLNPGID